MSANTLSDTPPDRPSAAPTDIDMSADIGMSADISPDAPPDRPSMAPPDIAMSADTSLTRRPTGRPMGLGTLEGTRQRRTSAALARAWHLL